MAKTHIVVEAHLEVDETVHNPLNVGKGAAKKITALLEELYTKKKEEERQVKTLVVSYRSMSTIDAGE